MRTFKPGGGEVLMPLFLGVHKFPMGVESPTPPSQSWESYKEAASSMGLKPIRVYMSQEKGVAYCQTEADTADQVKEAHQKAEIPFEDVYEVEVWE